MAANDDAAGGGAGFKATFHSHCANAGGLARAGFVPPKPSGLFAGVAQ
jgi:hypothetical protein